MNNRFVAGLLCLAASGLSAQTLTDPTRPLALPGGANSDLLADGFPSMRVEAVFIKASGHYAIVNGKTVYEGETYMGVTLSEISREGVVLTGENGRKLVPINNNKFIKDAANEW